MYSENRVECNEVAIDFYFYGLLAEIENEELCLDVTYLDAYNVIKDDRAQLYVMMSMIENVVLYYGLKKK